MAAYTVLFDACVLYPAPLRDLLMHLAGTELFHARWTDRIHDEWMRNLIDNRPDLTLEQLRRTRDLMNAAVPDCLITGYEDLMEGLELPDLDDRHVLAAAIHGRADAIITFNTSDFPPVVLSRFGVQAVNPDSFIVGQLAVAEDLVVDAARRHRRSLRKPPRTVDEYLDTLSRQRLPRTVECLRRFSSIL